MDINLIKYEEDFIANFRTRLGWFKAIRNKPIWMLYFGQEFLGKFPSIDKCMKHVENIEEEKA